MKANFTAALVDSLKPPEYGQVAHWDTRVRGLGFRLTRDGTKTWVLSYYFGTRRRWMTLGRYPALGLGDARELAMAGLVDVHRGVDPALAKQETRSLPPPSTWGDLVARYFDDHAREHKRSWREDERLLARYVPAAWKARQLVSFTRAEMVQLHASVGREHGRSGANHLMRLLRAMFNLARDWEMLKEDNPAARVKLFPEVRRERYLNADELRRINAALAEETNPYWRAFFALALLTGCRRSELLGARWPQVDFEAKTLRLPVTKAGQPHVLPLSDPALVILAGLPSREPGEFIFPSRGREGRLTEPKKAWARVLARAGVTDCRIHDLRHSLASILVQHGYGIALIGKILNHSQIATTARYSHLSLDGMRTALDDAAGLLLGTDNGTKTPPDNGGDS